MKELISLIDVEIFIKNKAMLHCNIALFLTLTLYRVGQPIGLSLEVVSPAWSLKSQQIERFLPYLPASFSDVSTQASQSRQNTPPEAYARLDYREHRPLPRHGA